MVCGRNSFSWRKGVPDLDRLRVGGGGGVLVSRVVEALKSPRQIDDVVRLLRFDGG